MNGYLNLFELALGENVDISDTCLGQRMYKQPIKVRTSRKLKLMFKVCQLSGRENATKKECLVIFN